MSRDAVHPADLEGRVLSLPYRPGVQSVVGNWMGESLSKVRPTYNVNLGGSVAALVEGGHAVSLLVEGCAAHWDPARFAVRPLDPPLESATVLAWKRGLRHTAAVQAFAEFAAERLRG